MFGQCSSRQAVQLAAHTSDPTTSPQVHDQNVPPKRLVPRMPKIRKSMPASAITPRLVPSDFITAVTMTLRPGFLFTIRSGRRQRPNRKTRPKDDFSWPGI